jgi:hypothetical protein
MNKIFYEYNPVCSFIKQLLYPSLQEGVKEDYEKLKVIYYGLLKRYYEEFNKKGNRRYYES